MAYHPLAPITAAEIRQTTALLQALFPSTVNLQFKTVILEEPTKSDVIAYLAEEAAEQKPSPLPRRVNACYYLRTTDILHEAYVNLSEQKVESNVRLGPNVHGCGDGEEVVALEKFIVKDPQVLAELEKLQLPKDSVLICDPWIYGSDGVDDDARMYQCLLYTRAPSNSADADSNHYAHPLPISVVVNAASFSIVRFDYLPMGADETVTAPGPMKLQPANEYTPEQQGSLRTDVKPLHIIQPEGVSFELQPLGETGHTLKWQKWSFIIGFNSREGMVLYDIKYDGRPILYRASLSDMNIPYADPRSPLHRKAAFDLGDAGAGAMANNLQLGCDCLGSISYISSVLANDKGEPMDMPNVVCVHEQDAGIGWKHTNYRTGRAVVTRNRELVLQSILTVANYEYILAFMFNQAGDFIYEVRATGILSTQPISEGVEVPWGTVVHPGVLAAHHQHFFSLRLDPFIDGPNNTVVYNEARALPRSDLNPHGTGYGLESTDIKVSGGYDADPRFNGTFTIANKSVRNPINNKPVGYKIHVPEFQKMLADEDSFHHKRAEFADHSIYVTKYNENELYSGGKYTNQSRGGTGVRSWAARKDAVENEDIIVWVQFGINHIPRIEDFPVMPCEIIKVKLRPSNFFTKNPALDVPQSTQVVNKSVQTGPVSGLPLLQKISEEKSGCCAST